MLAACVERAWVAEIDGPFSAVHVAARFRTCPGRARFLVGLRADVSSRNGCVDIGWDLERSAHRGPGVGEYVLVEELVLYSPQSAVVAASLDDAQLPLDRDDPLDYDLDRRALGFLLLGIRRRALVLGF